MITNNTTDTFRMTMVALNPALSRMPRTRIAVMIRAMQKAGKLKPTSVPNIWGA